MEKDPRLGYSDPGSSSYDQAPPPYSPYNDSGPVVESADVQGERILSTIMGITV